MLHYSENIIAQAAPIRLLICDVDGVLTNGNIIYNEQGIETKHFHVQDGLGLKLLQNHGIAVAIITSRQSSIVSKRMQELNIDLVFQGQKNKLPVYHNLLTQLNLKDSEVAYVGDDLPDLSIISRAGFGIAVANAHHYVKQQANWVTTLAGGEGAVREVCELILFAQHKLSAIYESYC